MAQEVALSVKLDGGDADKSVKSIKTQLKEAKAELIAMQQQFGELSPQALQAAKGVAQLKDQIQEAGEVAELFDPGKKFQALTGVINTVGGGFAALQGTIGLVAGESEELNKSLLKVQSALAISQGFSAIADSAKDFQRLNAIIKQSTIFLKANELANKATAAAMRLFGVSVESTSTSFKVLKGAIAATGIGLLVIALGEAVSWMSTFSDKTKEAAEEQENLNKKIVSTAQSALKASTDYLSNQEKIDIARAKAAGQTEDEIFKIEQRYRKLKGEALIGYYKEVKDVDFEASEEAKREVDRINAEGIAAEYLNQDRKRKIKEEANKKATEDAKNAAFEQAQIQQQALKDQYEKDELAYQERKKLREKQREEIKLFNQIEADNKAIDDEKKIENEKKFAESLEKLSKGSAMKFLEAKTKEVLAAQDAAEAKKKIEEMYYASKQKLVQMEIDLLFSLSDIVGQQTVAGKALAIAAATINTYQAASEALKANYGPFGPVAAVARFVTVAATIANGLKQVKAIVGVKVPGVSGGGGSAPSGLSAATPVSAPLTPTVSRNSLDQAAINDRGSAAGTDRPAVVRAIAVTGQITNEQEQEARLRRGARLGP